MPHTPLGYSTKQENIAVTGVADMVIRSLLDKQQFHDPLGAALRLGISSAHWPLFGLLWPSGLRLARRMAAHPVRAGERILEIGCGLALASLVAHRRGADVTASDCHPLSGVFLRANVALNQLPPLDYRHGQWGEGLQASANETTLSGRFGLIVASDVLYERDERGNLAAFIEAHASPSAAVWLVDPNRSNRPQFHRHMRLLGFSVHEQALVQGQAAGETPYRGRMLTYVRGA